MRLSFCGPVVVDDPFDAAAAAADDDHRPRGRRIAVRPAVVERGRARELVLLGLADRARGPVRLVDLGRVVGPPLGASPGSMNVASSATAPSPTKAASRPSTVIA